MINEFLPNGSQEWVEFYNTSNTTVDLSDYYFDDDTNFDSDSESSKIVELLGFLPSIQTCFWELSSYLNNDGDSPTLFKTNISMDTYSYSSSSAGFSYARVPDGGDWVGLQQPTQASTKCLDLAPSPTPTLSPTPSPTPTSPPAPTPTKTPTPTPTPKSPTPTPIQSSPTPKPTVTIFPTSVLGESTESAEIRLSETANLAIGKNLNDNDEKKVNPDSSENSFPVIFIVLGIVFIAACVILSSWQFIKNKNSTENE